MAQWLAGLRLSPTRCHIDRVRQLFTLLALGVLAFPIHAAELTRVRYNNPGLTVDLGVGLWAWPLPMDYDGDGDLDLLVSSGGVPYEGTYFFENPSPPGSVGALPVFLAGVRVADYRTNAQVSHNHGWPPIVTTPGQRHDAFLTDGFSNPTDFGVPTDKLYASAGRIRARQWKVADWEGDGDLDLLVGVGDWGDYGWDDAFDERGQWTNGPLHGYVYLLLRRADGSYSEPTKIHAGGSPVDVYGMPSPSLADFDSDGDLDLICGEFLDGFTYFQNVGSRSEPIFAAGRRLARDGQRLTMDLQMITPTAVDWDGDGDVDLIVGDEDGRVAFVANTGTVSQGMPLFERPEYFRQQAEFVKFGALVTPQAVDLDGDGDEDIVAGNTAGQIGYVEHLGGYPPRFAAPKRLRAGGEEIRIQAGRNGSIQGPCEAKWGYTTISVADWDGDELPDIVANSIWGKVMWYRNAGTKAAPRFQAARPVEIDWESRPRRPEWNWWEPGPREMASQWRTRPVAVDWDSDGLMDLVMLDHEGFLAWFRRVLRHGRPVLSPGQRIFYCSPESVFDRQHRAQNDQPGLLRLNDGWAGRSGRRKIDLVDWDGDGRLDLLVNSSSASLLKNTGSHEGVVRFEEEGPLSETRLAGHTSSPSTADWDGDGQRELLVGAEDGFLYWAMPARVGP